MKGGTLKDVRFCGDADGAVFGVLDVPVCSGLTVVLAAVVCSLKIEYRRKRNVGGRVLRNFARCSTDTLADTFREKMLHA